MKRLATILLKLAVRVVLHLNHMWFDFQENLTVKKSRWGFMDHGDSLHNYYLMMMMITMILEFLVGIESLWLRS